MADVAIDSSVATTLTQRFGARGLVAVGTSTLYSFYRDSDNDLKYNKSTDKGANWGGSVSVGVTAGNATGFDVWYDRWTPGDSGTLIHIFLVPTTPEAGYYISLDTSDDTLSTPNNFTGDWGTFQDAYPTFAAITKAIGGNLYAWMAGDYNTNPGYSLWRSTDGGSNWTERSVASISEPVGLWEEAEDNLALLPATGTGDTNDIWCVFRDRSANQVTIKEYDNSADDWVSESAAITCEGSSFIWQVNPQFSASLSSDGATVYVAAWNGRDVSTADLTFYTWTRSGGFSAGGNIVTNADDCQGISLCVDWNSGDIYAFYIGDEDGSEVIDSAIAAYYKKSTDEGDTWGSQQVYIESTYNLQSCHAPLSGSGVFTIACQFEDAAGNDLFTNSTKAITVTIPTLVTPGTLALVLSTFAPTVSTPRTVTPSTLALVISGFAPVVSVSDNQAVIPGTLALAITGFAPSVNIGINVTPGVLALILTAFEPTIVITAHQLVTPGTLALVLDTFAPDVGASVTIQVPTASLILSTFAPTVLTPRTATPGTLALVLTTFVPVILAPRVVEPGTLALVLVGLAPAIGFSFTGTPGTLALILTCFAPTVATLVIISSPGPVGSAVFSTRIKAGAGKRERPLLGSGSIPRPDIGQGSGASPL